MRKILAMTDAEKEAAWVETFGGRLYGPDELASARSWFDKGLAVAEAHTAKVVADTAEELLALRRFKYDHETPF